MTRTPSQWRAPACGPEGGPGVLGPWRPVNSNPPPRRSALTASGLTSALWEALTSNLKNGPKS